tara:strand:+ start:361 stop:594 length:234 start_codon:yes stop_codon:yes gene_type:complete
MSIFKYKGILYTLNEGDEILYLNIRGNTWYPVCHKGLEKGQYEYLFDYIRGSKGLLLLIVRADSKSQVTIENTRGDV